MNLDTYAKTRTPDLKIPFESHLADDTPSPCTIVIVGASGDLTSRKIVPALFRLFINDAMPNHFAVMGCARTELSDQEFRQKMEVAVRASGQFKSSKWEDFSACIYYRPVNYEEQSTFDDLAESLRNLDVKHSTRGNRVFYLAIPPSLYKSTATMLGKSRLSAEEIGRDNWSRIVVEKPFGRDLETAIDLDQSLHRYFQEHQIFRIDHYLAKETVQNILMFRFANSIFEPVWNRRYIEYISIKAAESLGVEHRAGYYEQAGVLRDMFQNHIMQLLALTAMEPPSRFEADRIRDEKVKVYRSLRPFPVDRLHDYLVLGQYDKGAIEGKSMSSYREEAGVNPKSLTPTFAMMKVFLDNWRWQGVPFYLSSGKRMAKKLTEITILFREVPHSMFRRTLGENITANRLTLGIYPDEKITLTFQTKNPGARVFLRSVTMEFNYLDSYSGPVLDAYEKVLLDCMLGDQMLFWRQDGVELCWSFLTPILRECESCGDREKMLYMYPSGSWGPVAAGKLIN